MYDVVVIGAGVSGCASARELSRFHLKICVVEMEEDVCCGTSKANSAIIHAGFDAESGSLKAKLNVEGSQIMERLSKDLDFHYQKNGSLVVCVNEGRISLGSKVTSPTVMLDRTHMKILRSGASSSISMTLG